MKHGTNTLEVNQNDQLFSQIYAENYAWLSNWLYRHLKSTTNLEDILQDTFFKLFLSNNVHLIREPKAYLASTARCLIINQTRHEMIEKQYLAFLAETQQNQLEHSPEQTLLVIELLHRISTALADLPERPRCALLLYYLEGKSQVEIAQQYQVTTRTIQNDLVKAVVHCHQYLHNETD